jgi:formate-dependent nitrite reductase membrane component NrfD
MTGNGTGRLTDVRRDTDPWLPPERDATPGSAGRGERRQRGERLMVPRAEFRSYYGLPVLNRPTWQAKDIASYLFLGGLAGASSTLAAAAELTGRDRLARAGKLGAVAALGCSMYALVHDLGRPSRFPNMLRVFKVTSPMSVGSWLLAGYGPQAGLAAVTQLTGRLPRTGRAAMVGAALIGPAVAAYTGVLISDTAVPAWHDGYREMPFVFVASAATAAGGLGMLAAPVADAAPARRTAALGAVAELAALRRMRRRLGMVAEPTRRGKGGRLLRLGEALTAAGAVTAQLAGRRRAVAAAAGLALLAGSACTRFGIFYAGVASAEDPTFTVEPQRERLSHGS